LAPCFARLASKFEKVLKKIYQKNAVFLMFSKNAPTKSYKQNKFDEDE
jgi:hypothetical protein